MRPARIALVFLLLVLPMTVAQWSLGCRRKEPPPEPTRKPPDDGRVDGYIRCVNPAMAAPQTNLGVVKFAEDLDARRAPQEIQFLQRELTAIEEILGLQIWQYQFSFPSNAVVEMTFRFKNGAHNHFTIKSFNYWQKLYPPAPDRKSEGSFLLFRHCPSPESGYVIEEKYLKHWHQGNTNTNPQGVTIPSTRTRWGLDWFDARGTRTGTSGAAGEELPWGFSFGAQKIMAESLLRPEWDKENILFKYEMAARKSSETNSTAIVTFSISCKVTRLVGTADYGKKEGGYVKDEADTERERKIETMWSQPGEMRVNRFGSSAAPSLGQVIEESPEMLEIFPDVIDLHRVELKTSPDLVDVTSPGFFEDQFTKLYDPKIKLDDRKIVSRDYILPDFRFSEHGAMVEIYYNKGQNRFVIKRSPAVIPGNSVYYGPYDGTPRQKLSVSAIPK